MAIMATKLSMSIPPYPSSRVSDSRITIFGVVPEAISAWNPETAPQAIVMKTNGNRLPGTTGPSPCHA